MYIAMLGRQPELGVAELESIYGHEVISYFQGDNFATLNTELTASDLRRLGSTVKLARIVGELTTTSWRDIEKYIVKNPSLILGDHTEGKLHLGFSSYGHKVSPRDINNTALSVKKVLRKEGLSVRIVPNKTPALGSAQVIHNHLTGTNGREFIAVKAGKKTILALTIAEQDIESYTARDQARPARDAFVGMLPPKLAQLLINLTGIVSIEGKSILDPFCGTGVVLQESLLMGANVIGTDLSEKMIDYSERNLKWLSEKYGFSGTWNLEEGDAMTHKWSGRIDGVACEGYLGQPFSAPPSPPKLKQVRENCNHIMGSFLSNISAQISSGTPVVVAVPAWKGKDGLFTHLPLTNNLGEYGFNVKKFTHTKPGRLLYFRDNQVVAREILVLVKR